MNTEHAILERHWAQAFAIRGGEGAYRASLSTMLPGGTMAQVSIEPGPGGRYLVSDRALARTAMLDAGVLSVSASDRRTARAIATDFGVEMDGDAFLVRDVDADQVASAAVYVAEASRRWASAVIEQAERAQQAATFDTVHLKLARAFASDRVTAKARVLGASTAEHQFDFLVRLSEGRTALFEVAQPAPSSIASTNLKFSDIAQAEPTWLREAVIADASQWTGVNIKLLELAAHHVRPVDVSWSDLETAAA